MGRLSDLGQHAFSLGGLRVWVHGWQYPWEKSYWDGNRLAMTAISRAQATEIKLQGPYLHVSDLQRWCQECESLISNQHHTVTLWAVEPELHIQLSGRGEKVRVEVRISPDLARQEHLYRFEVGWDEIEVFQEGLQRLIVKYPQRGEANVTPKAKRTA